MKLNKIQGVVLIFLLVIFLFGLLKIFYINPVKAQVEQPATANVTILGVIGDINISHYPVNFTLEGVGGGLAPATDDNPKANGPAPYIYPPDHGFITISANTSTNVPYNISINATNMTDDLGNIIPVYEIKFNSTCNDTLTELIGDLQFVCQTDGIPIEVPADENVNISFYLDVPAGQYNNTYDGEFWIYAHSYKADPNNNNRTWHGINLGPGEGNTTAAIKTIIDITWKLKPISFGTLIPGAESNATGNAGFPTNISSTPVTNVYIDLYLNGTDLFKQGDPTHFIGPGNITYSNATDADADAEPETWPDGIKPLPRSFVSETWRGTRYGQNYVWGGDFPNFGLIPNNSFILSWWNIIIPLELIVGEPTPGGDYVGDLYAKAVDAGYSPS